MTRVGLGCPTKPVVLGGRFIAPLREHLYSFMDPPKKVE